MDGTGENRPAPPEKKGEKRPNLGSKRENLGENSEKWRQKIASEMLIKPSIHRVKMGI
jgi:hypothetical protein